MDARERLLTALNWGEPDLVPLTCYDQLLPRGLAERLLRCAGLCLITRLPAHRVEYRNVEIITQEYWENAQKLIRKTIKTPVGSVWQTSVPDPAYGTSNWIQEHYVKGPDDYPVMEYALQDAVYHDNFEAITEAQRRLGSDGIVMVRLMKIPIQEMLYQMLGMERFALDYHFNRDQFDSLHNVMLTRNEELYDFASAAPSAVIQMSDNISSTIVGEDRFHNYCMPVYQRLRSHLQGTGKRVAVHMDGYLSSFKQAVAASQFDIVEAFTPPPMGDLSVKEARDVWSDKALWLNFTSSMHIEAPEIIEAHTRQLLAEAGTRRGFAISVTEDAPVAALERSLSVISQVLSETN